MIEPCRFGADMTKSALIANSVILVPGTREWIFHGITAPQRVAAHLGVPLAHDWDGAWFSAGAPYVLDDMKEGEEGWWYWWVIERPWGDRTSAALVGDAGFKGPPTRGGNVELMYAIAPSARRRGLASESVRMLVDWAFETQKVCRVIATIDPENVASRGVMRKCGFMVVGGDSDEDEVVYALDRNTHCRAS